MRSLNAQKELETNMNYPRHPIYSYLIEFFIQVLFTLDYGLIPGTYADDGDPLDILTVSTNATYPLTIVNSRPIGVLLMEDEKGNDEKILAVSVDDPYFGAYQNLNDLPIHYQNEISEFFKTYKNLEEPKYAVIKEWKPKNVAHEIIMNCISTFKEKFGDQTQVEPLSENRAYLTRSKSDRLDL